MECRGVVEALADRVDQIFGDRHWVEPGDQPCRGGVPWWDSAVIAQLHEHPEERLDHVDHGLRHPPRA